MKGKYLVILIAFSIFFTFIFANDFTVEAYVDRNEIGENEIFRFTVEAKGENLSSLPTPDLPDIPFAVLGSSRSSSSSVSIINGKMTSQKTERITFNLQAESQGRFQIPPVKVTLNKKDYYTRPITITVIEGTSQNQQPRSGNQAPFSSNQSNRNDGSETFFLATTDKNTYYQNEMIVVHYKLYTQSQISNVSLGSEPSFAGFWKEELYQADRLQMQREVYNGKQYNTLLLRSIALFPSREGKLMIPEFDLNVDIVVPARSFFDFNTSRTIKVSSKPIAIKVNPLPVLSTDKNFIGAVGNFDVSSNLSSNLSSNKGETGNSLTYRITISGTGNFNQTSFPKIPEVPGIRFLAPETEDIKTQSGTHFSGKRSFIYPVILQESGEHIIPEIEISWFNPTQKKYQSKVLKSETISVKPSQNQVITTPGSQQTIRVIGKDIQFINLNPSSKKFYFIYQKIWYWILLLFLPLTIIIHYIYLFEIKKLNNDNLYRRNRRANIIIKKYLKEANNYANQNSIEFYNSAYLGLTHFLTDKLNLPRGSVEKLIFEELNNRKIPQDLITKLMKNLEKINLVKYSNTNTTNINIKEDINNITSLFQELVTELNKKKTAGVHK